MSPVYVTAKTHGPDADRYCHAGDLDELTRSSLYISAVRTRTHIHETEPCVPCLQDLVALGRYGFALLNRVHELEAQIAERVREEAEREHEVFTEPIRRRVPGAYEAAWGEPSRRSKENGS